MVANESAGERFGRLAFAYCKIATVCLLLGRFALPVAAAISAILFVVGYIKGKKDTRCYFRFPLLAAGFWIVVVAVWFGLEFASDRMPGWIAWIHR